MQTTHHFRNVLQLHQRISNHPCAGKRSPNPPMAAQGKYPVDHARLSAPTIDRGRDLLGTPAASISQQLPERPNGLVRWTRAVCVAINGEERSISERSRCDTDVESADDGYNHYESSAAARIETPDPRPSFDADMWSLESFGSSRVQ